MRADPKPSEDISFADRKCAVRVRNAGRPKLTNGFQLNGRMPVVIGKQRELFSRAPLDVYGQFVITLPELGERFGLNDPGRDGGCSRFVFASARNSSMGRALPSAISRLTLAAHALPPPPGEKSSTICLSQSS